MLADVLINPDLLQGTYTTSPTPEPTVVGDVSHASLAATGGDVATAMLCVAALIVLAVVAFGFSRYRMR